MSYDPHSSNLKASFLSRISRLERLISADVLVLVSFFSLLDNILLSHRLASIIRAWSLIFSEPFRQHPSISSVNGKLVFQKVRVPANIRHQLLPSRPIVRPRAATVPPRTSKESRLGEWFSESTRLEAASDSVSD